MRTTHEAESAKLIREAYDQKHIDALSQLNSNFFSNKSYTDLQLMIETEVDGLPEIKAFLIAQSKIILALLKERDFSD